MNRVFCCRYPFLAGSLATGTQAHSFIAHKVASYPVSGWNPLLLIPNLFRQCPSLRVIELLDSMDERVMYGKVRAVDLMKPVWYRCIGIYWRCDMAMGEWLCG